MQCYNCGKENKQEWCVKFRDEDGKLHFKMCCSTDCCDVIKEKYCEIHRRRYEDTKYQSYQRHK